MNEFPVRTTPTAKYRILLVDSNIDALNLLEMLLEQSGHTVTSATNGEAALTSARTFIPDAVFTGIALDGLTGFQLATRLRAMPETANAMLVAVTGYCQEDDIQVGKAAGFDHFLRKPASFEDIVQTLAPIRV